MMKILLVARLARADYSRSNKERWEEKVVEKEGKEVRSEQDSLINNKHIIALDKRGIAANMLIFTKMALTPLGKVYTQAHLRGKRRAILI